MAMSVSATCIRARLDDFEAERLVGLGAETVHEILGVRADEIFVFAKNKMDRCYPRCRIWCSFLPSFTKYIS